MGELDHGHPRILSRGARTVPGGIWSAVAVVAVAAVAAVLAAGCTNGGSDESSDAGEPDATAAAGATAAPSEEAGEDRDDAGAGDVAGAPGFPAADPLAGRSIVYTATILLRSEDVPGDVAKATQIAQEQGGALFASEVSLEGTPSATLVLRVPPERLGTTLEELSGLGAVLGLTQDAQDVTTQVVDLDSRIATARVSVERLRTFLSEATSAADVAALEGELVRRETELEQLVAQQRALADQVALATITVELRSADTATPLGSVTGTVTTDLGPAEALRAGVGTLAALGLGVVLVVAWSLPFLLIAALVLVPVGIVWRRRRRRRPGPPAPPTGGVPAPAAPPAPPAASAAPAEPAGRPTS